MDLGHVRGPAVIVFLFLSSVMFAALIYALYLIRQDPRNLGNKKKRDKK